MIEVLRELRFTIYQNPVAQKRHRHSYKNVKCKLHSCPVVYNPSASEKIYYSNLIKQIVGSQPMMSGPVFVQLGFYMPIPKTTRKSKGLYHVFKPDIDNLIKFILDTMSGIIFKDDACVCKIEGTKFYSDTPRTEVLAREFAQQELT